MIIKKIVTLSLILASIFETAQATSAQYLQIGSPNAMLFTIQGDIQGLMPGDTLSFERMSLPKYSSEYSFDVIVEKPDKFTYSGMHENIGLYVMRYKPISGKKIVADRMGVDFLVKDGITHLIGTTDQIYYVEIKGGIYDNDLLQEAQQLEISLGKERGNLFGLLEEYRTAENTEKIKEYSNKINMFYSERQEEHKKVSELNAQYYENFPSSEHTVVDVLRGVSYRPFETTQSRYEKMDSEAMNSYFGKILKLEMDKIARLQPGKDAPDFHLTAIDGREIFLSDCVGSYVLIYHWGLCPGSIMINSEVIDLHNKYIDRLKIIGITDKIEHIKNLYDNTKPEDKFMHIELKPVLENMLAHPWFDAEKTGNNSKIEIDYAFGGLPYFVFISPEGKIIARDFHSAFYEAKNTMENEFGK